ncbi:hypothetical protein ACVIJU_000496 [Aeribacillus sp. SP014]|jgi:hypothetical protein
MKQAVFSAVFAGLVVLVGEYISQIVSSSYQNTI